nr:PD-(D/E)XK nuclease-like domain-containing protein [Mycobacterium eburneum]
MTAIPAEDGLHAGISDIDYHADLDSLSSSGARALLATCPARFHYDRHHPAKPKREYDVGHVVHALVLGEGSEIAVLDPAVHGLNADGKPSQKPTATAAWKQADAEARQQGKVPVHIAEYRMATEMARKVLEHPVAAALLNAMGYPELSGYWHDPITGVRLRYRPDKLVELRYGRIVCVDYKTTTDASPRHFAKQSVDFGYFQQDPWYRDGLIANGISADPGFVFIAQEKTAPYLVSVLEHRPDDIERGRRLNRAAVDLYARCSEADTWPGYGDGIHFVELPYWHDRQVDVQLEAINTIAA